MMRRRVPASAPATLLAAVVLLSACGAPRPVSGPAPTPVTEPEELGESSANVEEEVRVAKRDILGDVAYDLPLEANSWVESELDFLVQQRRAVIGRWLERGDFYEPFIKEVLRSHGLPTDLFHLAMIESGFLPTVKSRAGAVGLWQFMPATGRAMGLRVDSVVDERMDPVRSTRAAARHLRELRQGMGGDWALAAAAYNAGSGRITRGLKNYGVRNFWDLAQQGNLAEETKHYVPRLYAMTVITRRREQFGFPAASEQRFAYDSIQVEYATPLQELARMGEATTEQLARLNPHLRQGVAPAGGYWVWVPAGMGQTLQRAYLASDFRRDRGHGSYTVRKGDSLGKLAELAGIRSSRIRELNPGVDFDRLAVGGTLKLPYKAAKELSDRPVEQEKKAVAKASAKPALDRASEKTREDGGKRHEVKQGETLWGIAQKYGVTVAALQKANDLSGAAIRPGAELSIPKSGSREEAKVAEAAKHVVKEGDTLWGIARKYGSSVEAIQDVNRLGDRPIQAGQQLTIPNRD